ncbi:MAG: SDR family oxidoreductase [Candidatus Magasanikbacteria bacterium]|nr:SDR family oxidoreductase [Candidatus Magasanikbacteria bacterium]
MRILVTGGAGFIGSYISESIIGQGHEVVCVDNLFTGSMDNLEGVADNPRFTFIKHDIVEPLFIDGVIDQVYNLACPASPVQYQSNQVHTIKANTVGMINMLGLAREHGARFLQASTSEVYGDPEVHPQVEEYRGNVNPIGPRACYDEGKRVAETLCFDYFRMHGMEIKVVRIFNTYGPRMAFNDGRVVSNFIVQALKKEPLTLYGDGSQTRSFCYVDDLVTGLIAMMKTDKKITGPINLGNPQEMSIQTFAATISDLCDSKQKPLYKDLPIDDPRRRCPDITKAKKLLQWEPKVSLADGLKKTIVDFRARLEKSQV